MRRMLCICAAVLAILLLAGCGQGNSDVTGTWYYAPTGETDEQGETWEFEKDGSVQQKLMGFLVREATYTLEDGQVTVMDGDEVLFTAVLEDGEMKQDGEVLLVRE